MPTADINAFIKVCTAEAIKQAVQNKIDIYRDNWDYIIEEELALQFSPDTYKNLFWLKTKELNILKRVVNELSLVYKTPPIRIAYTENGEEEVPDANYELATKDTNKNESLKACNRYTNLVNHSAIHISYRNNKLDYQLYNFNNIEVFYSANDWTRIVAVKYYVGLSLPIARGGLQTSDPKKIERLGGTTDMVSIYKTQDYDIAYIWTAEDIDDKDNKILINDDIPYLQAGMIYTVKPSPGRGYETIIDEQPNTLTYPDGRVMLPFVIFDRIYPVDQRFDFTSGNDLVDLNLNVAIFMVLLNQLMKLQSFKQGVITGADPDSLPKPLFTDPQQWIALQPGRDGNVVDAKLLDLQANIEAFYKAIIDRVQNVLSGYGVSPQNFTMSATPSSGYALTISNMGKLEAREDQIDMYRAREKEIFEIERAVWNQNRPPVEWIDVKSEFRVDFPEPSYPRTPQEESAYYSMYKLYNAITDIDVIMEYNPDLSPEEAEELYKKNKAINAKTMALSPLENRPSEKPSIK